MATDDKTTYDVRHAAEGPDEPDSCALCGSGPAAPVTFLRTIGTLIGHRVEMVDEPLCRNCGIATFRDFTNRNLWQGWWSPTSFLATWWYLGHNLLARRQVAQLAAPAPAGDAPPEGALDPGRPLYKRFGPYVGVVVVTLVISVIAGAILASAQRAETGEITERGNLLITDLQVGDCFNEPDELSAEGPANVRSVEAVPCQEPHDSEVFAVLELDAEADAEYPGEQATFERASRACLPEFARFVGAPWDQASGLNMTVVYPHEDAWGTGDREVVCSVYQMGGPATGSLQGAAR